MAFPGAPRVLIRPAWLVDRPRAEAIARRSGCALVSAETVPASLDPGHFLLEVEASGLGLQACGPGAPGPVRVDFTSGALAHRRRFGGGAGQQLARALGLKPGIRPRVADLTAGLGRDAFVLASLGCEVQLVERSPWVSLLLEDGLERAASEPETAPIVARMPLTTGEARDWLEALREAPESERPDVVYLDPMFPESRKRAQVRKEMQLLRALLEEAGEGADLLAPALDVALARVVVKRPRKAPWLDGRAPGFSLQGRSGRFDVYPLRSLQPRSRN